jgi:poly-gamma-glutamate synthesis protein (capsule biosynthesis protein)
MYTREKKIIFYILLVFLVASSSIFFIYKIKAKENNIAFKKNQAESIGNESKQLFLNSFFENKDDYEIAYSKLSDKENKSIVNVGVVSHHFLARDLIANFFNKIDSENVRNVIIIGPDHYNFLDSKTGLARTSELQWQTPYGKVEANKKLINDLVGGSEIDINNTVFRTEHSIYTLIPFVKKSLDGAIITPLILSDNGTNKEFFYLGQKLSQALSYDETLIIISSDFVHKKSYSESRIIDKKNIEILNDLSFGKIDGLENDCKNCFYFLLGYLGSNDRRFELLENKTSKDYGSEKQEVTSYISGYYSMEKPINNSRKTVDSNITVQQDVQLDYQKGDNKEVSIIFTGDLMFDRYIRQAVRSKGNDFIFGNLNQEFAKVDLVVANLEGPLTGSRSVSVGTVYGNPSHMVFTFEVSLAETLKKNNIKLVNIGNNHILNFGNSGLEQTKDNLNNKGINYFGFVRDQKDPSYYVKEINGVKIGFINYNEFERSGYDQVLSDINIIKNSVDHIVIYTHWGQEYKTKSSVRQKRIAREFIDKGADLIIGSHPHVVQEWEEYNGKRIYYSLGNLIFDQYFSSNTMNGMLVKVRFNRDEVVDFKEYKVIMKKNGQTNIIY